MLDAKDAVQRGVAFTDAQGAAWATIERMAVRLALAERAPIATPMWNFWLPHKLKHYIDLINQPRLTFRFAPDAGYAPLLNVTPRAQLNAGLFRETIASQTRCARLGCALKARISVTQPLLALAAHALVGSQNPLLRQRNLRIRSEFRIQQWRPCGRVGGKAREERMRALDRRAALKAAGIACAANFAVDRDAPSKPQFGNDENMTSQLRSGVFEMTTASNAMLLGCRRRC